MPFFFAENLKTKKLDPKADRTIKARGGRLMITEMFFEAGGVGAVHDHEHEQIMYVIDGELDFQLGDETFRVKSGDSAYIPPKIPHGCVAIRPSRVLDVFSPQRDDFLE